ncbi:MAG: restriction endonuclease subunit S [Lacunisphaera sp.]|nr:restriction endonuclease subunit S [Lacunisphaera sp.]
MAASRKVKLADCVNLLAGFPFKSQQFTDKPEDVPLVKGENVSQGCILWDISKRWPASDWEKLEKFHLVPGDVVIAMDRPWIPAGLKWSFIRERDPKALLVQRCARLRASDGSLDQNFLRFVIGGPGFENYVKPITTGVNVPHISGQQILDFEFPLPPLPVQRRIAGILSAYDELMENSQRRIRILEAMARTLYREWFVHFRFPGHEKLPRVVSLLGDIPKGWEVKAVESFCPLVSRGVTPKYELGSGRFIINQKVNRGLELSLVDLKELEPSLEVPPDKFARFGDVLVNCLGEGTIGRVHFYTESHQDWAVDQHMSICRAANPTDALYVYFALESEEGQGRITALKTGGTNMTMFNISALRSFAVVAPPAKLLTRFAELAFPMLRQKQALTELNRNLRRTRDLLLPRLLSAENAP